MKYHLKAKDSENAHCGVKASPTAFIYELPQFNAHFNAEHKCKRCGKAALTSVVPTSTVTLLPTKKGYSASIETDAGIFHLRNAFEPENNLTSIDISAEDGTFIEEYASGFGVSDDRQDEDNLKNLECVARYINENIIL